MQLIVKSFEVVIIPVLMLQISCKPVVHAHHDFKILMHNWKGEQINFKFLLFIQFRLLR